MYAKTRHLPDSVCINLSLFQTIIEIKVDNVNDNTPQFAETPYSALVNENATIGTIVLAVNAMDADQGPSGELRFEIIGGNIDQTFRIDPVVC